MPSLLDTLDRFNYTSSSIRSLAQSQPPRTNPGPFTAAILQLTLHDLLREADDSEYGLFTFIRESSDAPLEGTAAQGKVGRKEFRGATPLRAKRVAGAGANREEEPEVYVEAALKYLHRLCVIRFRSSNALAFNVPRLGSIQPCYQADATCSSASRVSH